MKKILLASLFLPLAFSGFAQSIFSEDFEYDWQFPAGWTVQNTDYFAGWVIGMPLQLSWDESTVLYHQYCVYVADKGCGCDNSNELLFTPGIDLSTAAHPFLTFDSYFYKWSNLVSSEAALVEVSTDDGNSWALLENLGANQTAWEKKTIDLTAYAGLSDVRIGFRYSDSTYNMNGWAVDDVMVTDVPTGTDIALDSITVGKFDPRPEMVSFTKYLSGLPLSINLVVRNTALQPITSFDVTIDDSVNTFTESITGQNIQPLEEYSFFISQPYTTLTGTHTISATISNVNNGATELSGANNISSASLTGVTPDKDKVYFAEEGTGTWCGWCPRGAVFMDYMRQLYPDNFVEIAVHSSDVMTLQPYDFALGLSAFPSVSIDRDTVIDPLNLEADFVERITHHPPVKISGSAVYDGNTNLINIQLHADFLQSLNGDYRFNAIIAEDSVHNTASSYDQGNSYSGMLAGLMGGFDTLSDPVAGTFMNYNAVARMLVDGFNGTAGSLPNVINMNSSYDYSYSVPSQWDVSHLFVAGIIVRNADSVVMNAVKFPVTISSGINSASSEKFSAAIFPNPTSGLTYFIVDHKNLPVIITISNSLGQIVATLEGSDKITFNTKNLPAGFYSVQIKLGDEIVCRKLVVEKH